MQEEVYPTSPITEYTEQDETKYYYNGRLEGLIQYKSYITDDDVKNNIVGLPLEDDGGSGTANVHFEYGQLDGVTENNRYINGHWRIVIKRKYGRLDNA